MKRACLILLLITAFRSSAQSESCCNQVFTSVTNNPFACVNDPDVTIPISQNLRVAIKGLIPGGTTIRSGFISNGSPFLNKSYTSEIYGFNGKLVRVFHYVPPWQTNQYPIYLVLDDACQEVCRWIWIPVFCVLPPCPPIFQTNCTNPSFFESSIKIGSL